MLIFLVRFKHIDRTTIRQYTLRTDRTRSMNLIEHYEVIVQEIEKKRT
jgi:GTPase involved in cell partitioning and DNA repair